MVAHARPNCCLFCLRASLNRKKKKKAKVLAPTSFFVPFFFEMYALACGQPDAALVGKVIVKNQVAQKWMVPACKGQRPPWRRR